MPLLLPLLLAGLTSEEVPGLDCLGEARRFLLDLRQFLDGYTDKTYNVSCPRNSLVSESLCDHEMDGLTVNSDDCGILSLSCHDASSSVSYVPTDLPDDLPDLSDGFITVGSSCSSPLVLGLTIGTVALVNGFFAVLLGLILACVICIVRKMRAGRAEMEPVEMEVT